MAKKDSMKVLDRIAISLMVVGSLVHLLVGLANVNVVTKLFGSMTFISRSIYIIVGVAAIYYVGSKIKRWMGI